MTGEPRSGTSALSITNFNNYESMPYMKRDRVISGRTISPQAYKLWTRDHVLPDRFRTQMVQWTIVAATGLAVVATQVYA